MERPRASDAGFTQAFIAESAFTSFTGSGWTPGSSGREPGALLASDLGGMEWRIDMSSRLVASVI